MGDANASIPTPQPVLPRPMFGASRRAPPRTSVHFVAPAAIEDGLADRLAYAAPLVPVADTRRLGKAAMPLNDALPEDRGRPRHLHGPRSTATRSSPRPAVSCPWPSATSCSDDPMTPGCCCSPTRGSPPAGTRTRAASSRPPPAGAIHDLATSPTSCADALATAGLVAAALAAAGRECGRPASRTGAALRLDAEADARTPSPAQRQAPRVPRAARCCGPLGAHLAVGRAPTSWHALAAGRPSSGRPRRGGGRGRAAPPEQAAAVAAYGSVTGPAIGGGTAARPRPARASTGARRPRRRIDAVAAEAVLAARDWAALPARVRAGPRPARRTHIRADLRLFES